MTARQHNYLRSCRRKAGLTQHQLAFIAGLDSPSRISALENGRTVPTVYECVVFERLFGRAFPNMWPQVTAEIGSELESRIREMLRELEKTPPTSERKRHRVGFMRRCLESVIEENPNQ